mmetsp:Transcript_26929/g.63251  ORF Transcript_26929/g.63251 Transcript_26929/m.63251 type:complete len:224 (-) Transcript_26929:97-768(-)
MMVLCKLARLNCAISTFERDMSASSKLLPSSVASKNEDPTRLLPLKFESRTMLCWNATPFRFCLLKSDRSRLTPRVIAIVRPDWSVEAPPVVILEFAPISAPPSAKAGWPRNNVDATASAAAAAAAVFVATVRSNDCWWPAVVRGEAAPMAVEMRADSGVDGTDANPFALPATATRTAAPIKSGWDVFIVCCCVVPLQIYCRSSLPKVFKIPGLLNSVENAEG